MPPNPETGDEFAAAMDPLREWAAAATGLPVVADWADDPAGDAVLVRPIRLRPAPESGPLRTQVSSADVVVDVLVAVVGALTGDAAGATTRLALSAVAEGGWEMDAAGPSPELWLALGHPPVPALLLAVPVHRLLDRGPAPRVREPLRTRHVPMRGVSGRVVWTDGRPVAAARVAPADDSAPPVVTDHAGRFRLTLAAGSGALQLVIAARGESTRLTVDSPAADGGLGDFTVAVPASV